MATKRASPKPRLSLRIDFGSESIGPGKIQLLELIDEHGSISAAGRALGMSYRRAWLLIDELNHAFKEPLVASETGGRGGGGAVLTRAGRKVAQTFRTIEKNAAQVNAAPLKQMAARFSGSTQIGTTARSTGLMPKRHRTPRANTME